jgi:hypothetical protein
MGSSQSARRPDSSQPASAGLGSGSTNDPHGTRSFTAATPERGDSSVSVAGEVRGDSVAGEVRGDSVAVETEMTGVPSVDAADTLP